MPQETVRYEADGLSMIGTLCFEPADGPRPGVLVFPEAFGPGEHTESRCRRLAEMGYVALGCDLHGDARYIESVDEAVGALKPLFDSPDKLRARALSPLALLRSRPEVDTTRLGAIGFCFGGTMALELARNGEALRAVVGFHSGLSTKRPAAPGTIAARVLACIGADDPMIPPEQRAAFETEMRDAKADWQLHVYGNTVHGFTFAEAHRRNKPEAIRYSPEADTASWAAMSQLFVEAFAAA
jgi:dienelactone hydrolase